MGRNDKFNKIGDLIQHPKIGEGTYRVTGTALTGGGYGHGPGNYYPDGHELTLMPESNGTVDWSAKPKHFFQSGCFCATVMLPYCKPIVK